MFQGNLPSRSKCFSRWPSLPRVRSSPLAATYRACTYHRSTFLQRPLTSARNLPHQHLTSEPDVDVPSGKGNVHTLQRPTPIYASRLTKINCDSALPCRKSPCLSPRYVIDNIFQASQSSCELQLLQSQQCHVPTCTSLTPHFFPSTWPR